MFAKGTESEDEDQPDQLYGNLQFEEQLQYLSKQDKISEEYLHNIPKEIIQSPFFKGLIRRAKARMDATVKKQPVT